MFKSTHAAGEWRDAVIECLRALGSLDGVSGPGFVYATEHHADHLHQIEAALRDGTGIQDWVGSIGMGIVAGARAFFDEPALAVMVADVADGAFAVRPHIAPEDLAELTAPGPPDPLSGLAFGRVAGPGCGYELHCGVSEHPRCTASGIDASLGDDDVVRPRQ